MSDRTDQRPKRSWLARRLGRGVLVASIPLAVVGGVRTVGWTAGQLKQWNDGDTLKAADINGNFAALSAQIAALTAPLRWTKLPLVTGWAAYGDGYGDPGYAKDALGIVHLRGLVKGSPAPQTIVANLPAGFRPAVHVEELLACGGTVPCTVVAKTTGELVFEQVSASSTWLSLDGLTFEAAAGP
jgi:hypothetical protein